MPKGRRGLIALALAGSLLIATATPALGVVRACTTSGTIMHRWVERNWLTTNTAAKNYDIFRSKGQYNAVYGTAYIRDLEPCSGEGGNQNAMVLPANLDNLNAAGDIIGMLQLGYWERSDGVREFGYTVTDNNVNGCSDYGCMIKATWAETPEIGNRYSFEIKNLSPGSTGWTYTIKDLTDNQQWSFTHMSNWINGERVWYTYESHDVYSNLGVWGGVALQARIAAMQRRHTDFGWSRIDGLNHHYTQNAPASPHFTVATYPQTTTPADTFNIYTRN